MEKDYDMNRPLNDAERRNAIIVVSIGAILSVALAILLWR